MTVEITLSVFGGILICNHPDLSHHPLEVQKNYHQKGQELREKKEGEDVSVKKLTSVQQV
ncbi:hypothetical protein [Achromobacter marplatensis]|uniref:hypothetical protein n=1 Tax=Achromobacter marplatensis TaxID=470868 RepID=UPI003C75E1FE